jgi:hypothetical protein
MDAQAASVLLKSEAREVRVEGNCFACYLDIAAHERQAKAHSWPRTKSIFSKKCTKSTKATKFDKNKGGERGGGLS